MPKYGKIGPPKSAKRKAFLAGIRRKIRKNPRSRVNARGSR